MPIGCRRVPGERQEHVVERGPPDPEVIEGDAAVVERPTGGDEHLRTALDGETDLFEVDVEAGRRAAERGHQCGGPLEIGRVGDPDLEDVTAELVLELIRRSLGNDATGVEHDDPVRQVLCFVHVLRREQDGGALGQRVLR